MPRQTSSVPRHTAQAASNATLVPERQPQLLWSKEELASDNRKSIYTMSFVSDLGYGVHLF